MNKNILAAFVVAALTLTACKKEATTTTTDAPAETTTVDAAVVEGTPVAVQPAESKIDWEGGKVTGSKHMGTINIQEGNLLVNEGKVVGGNFVVDMTSINVTDLTDAEKKGKLEGHLKGLGDDAESKDHFFNTTQYPTGTLAITKVGEENGKQVFEGDLTLKGKSNPVKFTGNVTQNGDVYTLTTDDFEIDRTLWNVNYGSGSVFTDLAADEVIKNEIKLKANVVAK